MHYINYIQPNEEQQKFDIPIALQLRSGKIHPICCLQSLHSTDLKYDWHRSKGNPLQQNNGHPRCSSIRKDPSHQAMHPKSNYRTLSNVIRPFLFSKINQINTHHNRSETIIRSPETIAITSLLPNQKKEYARNL